MFIYLAAPGLSYGMWYLVPWPRIQVPRSQVPCIGSVESQPLDPIREVPVWAFKYYFSTSQYFHD